MAPPLLSCQNLSKSHGSRLLFSNLSLQIFPGDRIGLVGPNGSGKSTLLRILARADTPDSGVVMGSPNLVIGYVPQESTHPPLPVEEVVASKLTGEMGDRLTRARIELGKVGFADTGVSAATLSGGWKKRLDIACALAHQPALLLLDEPTNHLDLEGTLWLERFLSKPPCPFVLVSHDRLLLEKVVQRMVEVDKCYPNGLYSVTGNYSKFLEQRELFFAQQTEIERSLRGKVRREVDWLRRTPAARTTKSQSRVDQAERLIDELSQVQQRRQRSRAEIGFEATDRQAKKLLVATNLSKRYGERTLFEKISFTLSTGSRLAIAGTNGSGKSTLLRMLTGEESSDTGTIKQADGLRIVYFDQHREGLDPKLPLRRALAPSSDTVIYRGQSIHVNGWAQRFLFSPDRLDLPVGNLSGGERARCLIARLMLQPADLLLLDEPTNDLDIPTLEVLEESLIEFPGAIVLVTHDRYVLERVSTEVLGLGVICDNPLFASYDQWEKLWLEQQEESKPKREEKPVREKVQRDKRLSYNEQRELDQMDEKIEAAEKRIVAAERAVAEADSPQALQEKCQALAQAQKELDLLFQRWEELEKIRN
jgi:ABC transport system ATP-binding/permease protein